jgi:hypothetical protein
MGANAKMPACPMTHYANGRRKKQMSNGLCNSLKHHIGKCMRQKGCAETACICSGMQRRLVREKSPRGPEPKSSTWASAEGGGYSPLSSSILGCNSGEICTIECLLEPRMGGGNQSSAWARIRRSEHGLIVSQDR